MEKIKDDSFFMNVIKSAFTGLIFSLVGIFIFSFVIKFANISAVAIKSVNQFIKVFSLFIGATMCIRGKNGLIKGALMGIISMCLIYLIFLLTGAEISKWGFILDLVFGLVAGGISGIIAVNIKK